MTTKTTKTTAARWRKSTRSAAESGACVELSSDGGVRDSKNPAVTLDARGLVSLARSCAGRESPRWE